MWLLTSRYRRLCFAFISIVVITILAACGSQTTQSPASGSYGSQATQSPASGSYSSTPSAPAVTKTVQVKIIEQNGKYSFEPATLTVAKGTRVTWTNASDAPHTVSSDTNVFNTPSNLTENQTFSMTFNTAGTYSYHCSIHTYMKATITVTA